MSYFIFYLLIILNVIYFQRVISADPFDGILNRTVLNNWKIKNNSITVNLIDKQIKSIENETFKEFLKLQSLDLTSNLLISIDSFTFSQLYKLEKLKIINNLLENIDETAFDDLLSLNDLDLSFNQLNQLKSNLFQKTINMEILDLSNNLIDNLDPKIFINIKNLTLLNLNNNQLKSIDFIKPLINLSVLECNSNRLKYISNDLLNSSLKRLYLDHNLISMISFKKTNLIFLSLTGNLIADFNIESDTLEEINLNENNLTFINEDMFLNMKYLKTINLSYNFMLMRINLYAFKYLDKLESIDLSKTPIALYLNNKLQLLCCNPECIIFYE